MSNHPDPSPTPQKRATGQPDAIADTSVRVRGFDSISPTVAHQLINDLVEMTTLNRKETVCVCHRTTLHVGPYTCPVHGYVQPHILTLPEKNEV